MKKGKGLKLVVYLKPPKESRFLLLCKDKLSGKWCFVDVTSMYVCSCRYDTMIEALKGLTSNEEVEYYSICDDMLI